MGKRGARSNASRSGATGRTGHGHPYDRRGSGRGQARPRTRTSTRALLVVGSLIAVALAGGVALAEWPGRGDGTATEPGNIAASPMEQVSPKPVEAVPVEPPASPGPGGSGGPGAVDVPRSGPGTFSIAKASGKVVGTGGPLRRYQVQVEDGADVSAEQAAIGIQAILSDPRSWAAHGKGRFQLVATGADVVIKIATPKTTDKLCAAVGDTGGELNCEVGGGVVVNLKRWVTGSPQYDGPPAEYRHLIINHEIGHLIGYHQHMACPGAGKPAPVMMQQIKGLNGCTSNAWPYTAKGAFVSGPSVP
ncbi:DUF3152 domain-containing protein [Streptomyces sp. NBC_00442]|uniref:DUF3152 domain-containing protein n=1 Tax=Streptomyces sp. NBC_00442 TaxID=2903651 RepID=UPI002E1C644A